MATLEQLVGIIVARLGNRKDLAEYIVTEADYQREFVLEIQSHFRPIFLLNSPSVVSTVADQAYIDIPTDFLAEFEDGFLSRPSVDLDGQTLFLRKGVFDFQETTNKGSGRPTHYVMRNKKIFLYPVPDAIYSLDINYYAKTSSLKEAGTNPWLDEGFDWLVNTTGAVVSTFVQNVEMSQIFASLAHRAAQRQEGIAIEFVETNLESGRDRTV